ncbi:hypothetical protein MKQ70_23940 [Chitinophaga sedimenti]|uniref:hypothetical protein n=1 Tax=Chitinophaga sedimenti TaxID=2033606 RepID=UPI002002C9EA|nr:hypothetical protein [Chitinophaga sedimenti]MCK7557893.1 hypothetical protein [Chitinophaga sedimenti]
MRALKMLALSLVTLTVITSAKAQTAEEIVQKHIDAMGGAEKSKPSTAFTPKAAWRFPAPNCQ